MLSCYIPKLSSQTIQNCPELALKLIEPYKLPTYTCNISRICSYFHFYIEIETVQATYYTFCLNLVISLTMTFYVSDLKALNGTIVCYFFIYCCQILVSFWQGIVTIIHMIINHTGVFSLYFVEATILLQAFNGCSSSLISKVQSEYRLRPLWR